MQGHRDGQEAGIRKMRGGAEETGLLHLERRRLQQYLTTFSDLLPKGKGFLEKTQPGFPQRCIGEGRGATGTS